MGRREQRGCQEPEGEIAIRGAGGGSVNATGTLHGDATDRVHTSTPRAKEFEIKIEILGPEEGEVKELGILNRVICWEEGGLE